jgi:hypothetical protein
MHFFVGPFGLCLQNSYFLVSGLLFRAFLCMSKKCSTFAASIFRFCLMDLAGSGGMARKW